MGTLPIAWELRLAMGVWAVRPSGGAIFSGAACLLVKHVPRVVSRMQRQPFDVAVGIDEKVEAARLQGGHGPAVRKRASGKEVGQR